MRSLAERSHRQHSESWLHKRAQIASHDAVNTAAALAASPPRANDESSQYGDGHATADDATRTSCIAISDPDDLQLSAIALSESRLHHHHHQLRFYIFKRVQPRISIKHRT